MKITFDDTLNAINGKNYSEKIPYSLWKHFPEKDLKVHDIIKSHLDFQNLIESDLIKFSPNSKYCVMDFGLEIGSKYDKQTGSYITQKYPINSIADWEQIDEIDPLDGHLGTQLSALSKFSKLIENKPIMMTIFLPMMVAEKLVSNDNLIDHVESDKSLIKDRLKVIEKVMSDFSLASLDEGADGLFLATQHTQETKDWNAKDWFKYIYPFDNNLIKTVDKKSMFTVLHFHGSNIFFEEVLKKMKVTAMNWHPLEKLPSFLQNPEHKRFIKGLVGGLDEEKIKNENISEIAMSKIIDFILEKYKSHLAQLIIAPGCVLPQDITIDNLQLFLKKLNDKKILVK